MPPPSPLAGVRVHGAIGERRGRVALLAGCAQQVLAPSINEATIRLLYYFPEEAAPLIAARLKSLDVSVATSDQSMQRDVKNRVATVAFIEAVTWCQATAIREALADIAKRTDDPQIKKLLTPDRK